MWGNEPMAAAIAAVHVASDTHLPHLEKRRKSERCVREGENLFELGTGIIKEEFF